MRKLTFPTSGVIFLLSGRWTRLPRRCSPSRPVTLLDGQCRNDPGGESGEAVCKTLSAPSRRKLLASGKWPKNSNLVLTNYSQFSGGEEAPSRNWAESAPDGKTLLILDECHNAINANSNTGRSVRAMIAAVGRANVVFATATPLRNPSGADLYKPLLPDTEGGTLEEILASLSPGGETAQESFTSMLAEDGVFCEGITIFRTSSSKCVYRRTRSWPGIAK